MKKLVTKTEEVEVVQCRDCGKEMEKHRGGSRWNHSYYTCSGCGELVCRDCVKTKGGQFVTLPWENYPDTFIFCASCVAANPPIVQLVKRLSKATTALDKRCDDLKHRLDILKEAMDPEDLFTYHRIKASNNACRKDTVQMGVPPAQRPCGLFSGSRFCVLKQVGHGKGLSDLVLPVCLECFDYLEFVTRPNDEG